MSPDSMYSFIVCGEISSCKTRFVAQEGFERQCRKHALLVSVSVFTCGKTKGSTNQLSLDNFVNTVVSGYSDTLRDRQKCHCNRLSL